MKITSKARQALDDVSHASRTVTGTAEWATVALVAVAVVSVLALGVATVALHKAGAR